MKRNYFLLALVFLQYHALLAQGNGRANSPGYYRADSSRQTDIREKLVQLALQNPDFEISDRRISIADYNVKRAKGEWLGALGFQINVNELSVNKTGFDQVYYPLYNLSLNVPFNYYTQRKYDVAIARENFYIAQAEKNSNYRRLRTIVLTKYEDYLMYKEKLELQSRITQDTYFNFKVKEEEFADNLIQIDEYNKAFALWKEQQDFKLEAQRNLNVSKLELEEMIGVSLDDVLGKK